MPKRNTRVGLTATQLPSGSWRVQTHGRSFTGLDKRSVLAQAMDYKMEIENNKRKPASAKTLGELVLDYIDESTTLSPGTIDSYAKIQRNMFLDLQRMRCTDITKTVAQKSIREHQQTKAPKYVVNSWNLLHRASTYYGEVLPAVDLPTVEDKDLTWIPRRHLGEFLKAIEGDSCEIAMMLGLMNLRTAEVYGLKWKDIDYSKGQYGILYIHATKVKDKTGTWVFREKTKTSRSRRKVPITVKRLRDILLEAQGEPEDFIVSNGQTTIRTHIRKACAACGITETSMHGLRRSFASLSRGKLDDLTTMKLGGWSTTTILKRTYQRMDEQELIEEAAELVNFYDNIE